MPTNEDSLYYTKISFDVDTTSNNVRWFVDQFLLLKVCFCISAEVRLQTRQSQCQEEHIQLVSTTHQQPTLTSPNIATCKHRLLLVWASFYLWCNKPTTTSLEFSACGALNLMDLLQMWWIRGITKKTLTCRPYKFSVDTWLSDFCSNRQNFRHKTKGIYSNIGIEIYYHHQEP